MIVQQEFLNKLKDFGLNSYESKLWAALLSRGISTAGELSDIANVPRSRSYDVLESLERKGFIIMKLGKPIRYIAVSPSEVLERMKKKVVEDSEKKTVLLNKLKDSEVLGELNVLHNQGIELVEPTDMTGVLKGRNNLYLHMDSMIKNAQSSIVIATTEEGLIRKAESLKNSLMKAKAKGVSIRIAAPITKRSIVAARKLSPVANVRHIDSIKARYCVIDGKEMTFTLLDDKETHPSYDVGIWVNSKFFAKSQEDSFNLLWEQMKPADRVKTK